MLTAHLEARFFHDSSIWPFSRKKARADNALTCCFLVAPTGFEPATSALRGRFEGEQLVMIQAFPQVGRYSAFMH